MSDYNRSDPVYTASQLVSAFAGGDILTMLTSAGSKVEILSVEMSQIPGSTAPLVHPMSVEIFKDTTSEGTGGATITPAPMQGHAGARASTTTVLGPPSAGNSTASATRLHAGGFGVDGGQFCWEPCVPPVLSLNDSLHVRTSTSVISTAGVTLAMTLTFRELGKMPL
jgi:hypothetical protein